uniref:Uncharacterized protein n=1 Tax=Sphaerodactylus townsendi TaxID=933632 RepID=A0ACB8FTS8_9SAUR
MAAMLGGHLLPFLKVPKAFTGSKRLLTSGIWSYSCDHFNDTHTHTHTHTNCVMGSHHTELVPMLLGMPYEGYHSERRKFIYICFVCFHSHALVLRYSRNEDTTYNVTTFLMNVNFHEWNFS